MNRGVNESRSSRTHQVSTDQVSVQKRKKTRRHNIVKTSRKQGVTEANHYLSRQRGKQEVSIYSQGVRESKMQGVKG
jgi:uncharacterized membrane protein YdbT with pleckstrin-like domain